MARLIGNPNKVVNIKNDFRKAVKQSTKTLRVLLFISTIINIVTISTIVSHKIISIVIN